MNDQAAYEHPFFAHRECEFFPCHEGVDPDEFNCLFCYCPLYVLGDECGGEFTRTADGVKDCSPCTLPHRGDAGTKLVTERFDDLRERMDGDARR